MVYVFQDYSKPNEHYGVNQTEHFQNFNRRILAITLRLIPVGVYFSKSAVETPEQ